MLVVMVVVFIQLHVISLSCIYYHNLWCEHIHMYIHIIMIEHYYSSVAVVITVGCVLYFITEVWLNICNLTCS